MKVVFTEIARRDLDEILGYLAENRQNLARPIEHRIHAVLDILARWPESGRIVFQRLQVRVASLIHYPYRIFYRVAADAIEVVHIRHTSRRPWDERR
jgi:plasmid stabilization system protein ParE